MAKTAAVNKSESSKYMALKVYGARRLLILFTLVVMSIGFGFLFERTILNPDAQSSVQLYGAIFLACLLMVFLPISEEWQYGPWQDGCRKCEKNIYN
jgi:hypothetical protein